MPAHRCPAEAVAALLLVLALALVGLLIRAAARWEALGDLRERVARLEDAIDPEDPEDPR